MKNGKPVKAKVALSTVQKWFPQVEQIYDAEEPISVTVTERDSANSRLRSHAKCALAEACKRKEKADGVIISRATAYIIKGKAATRFKVPASAAREIVSFDRKGGFAPGEYHLRPPAPSEKLGVKTGSKANPSGEKRKIRFHHVTARIRTALKSVS